MSEQQALDGFLDKWRARWPEWRVAEVFVPAPQREVTVAWFALQQELTDAAWAGSDPRPGEAKLAWWAEELHGWSQGRRRHPLGIALQRLPALWLPLAASLPTLLASREPASGWEDATGTLESFAQSTAGVADIIFSVNQPTSTEGVVVGLLAQQVLLCGDAAAPLRMRAQLGDAVSEHAAVRAWAQELLRRWPSARSVSRPDRIFAALLRERLRRFGGGSSPARHPPRLATLWTAWRAARA